MKRTVVFALLVCAASHAEADGPVGIGPIKIGMTRDAVEALPRSGDVYLAAPLAPHTQINSSDVGKPGEDRVDTALKTVWGDKPYKTMLTFSNGRLSYILLDFNSQDYTLRSVADQIASKYGPAKVTDNRETEYCRRYGGGSEEVKSGPLDYTWTQANGNDETRTHISFYTLDGCSSRSLNMDARTTTLLSIYRNDTPNPF